MFFVLTILIVKAIVLFFCCVVGHKSLKANNFKKYYLFFGVFLALSLPTWILITIPFFMDKISSNEVNIFTLYNGVIYGAFLIFTFIENLKYRMFLKIGNVVFPLMAGLLFLKAIKYWTTMIFNIFN